MASLPPGLWDLTMSRISSPAVRLGRLGFAHSARNNAQAALARAPGSTGPPPFPLSPAPAQNDLYNRGTLGRRKPGRSGALTPRSEKVQQKQSLGGAIAELENRVKALKEAADVEVMAAGDLVFSEKELLGMYEDLLAHPQQEQPTPTLPASNPEADLVTLHRLEQELLQISSEPEVFYDTPLVSRLRAKSATAATPTSDTPLVGELHHRVLKLANARLDRLESLQPSSSTSSVPIVLFSLHEYEALTRTCIDKNDLEAAEGVLHLMKRSALPIPEAALTAVLQRHTEAADVHRAEMCLANFLTGAPTLPQRHLHVKCHLKATPRDRVPESALAVLHSYEGQGHPAPMKTYTSAISALYSTNLSIARAQAWDLFSHMRYVAHPTPDVVLYTAMIRACASAINPARGAEPERALDLWTEMTVEKGMKPTVETYNAVILACARSGRKEYVNEGFRIAKQMLDANRDAYGRSAYLPNRRTLCALLEGAKRIGDLARARWILADMVRSDAGKEEGVNEEIMMHVFHTYTAYVPPFTRHLAVVVPGKGPAAVQDTELATDAPPAPPRSQRFTRVPPQTSNEVMEEVQALFQRVLEDTGRDTTGSATDTGMFSGEKKFQHVEFTTRLVNSYLAVFYQHSSLQASAALFSEVWERVGCTPDPRSYLEALERCARSKRGRERHVGLEFAERVWKEWRALEDSRRGLDPRMVERAHVAFMRVLALNDQLQRALDLVKAFAQRYPPSQLREVPAKPGFRANRTALVGARPLVRLTAPNEVPDDGVPPLLMFSDLEILHHRLVAAGMTPGIGYVKYISKAYEWALRARRDSVMRARSASVQADGV
ncbi:hypothetical protein FB45DRAFT_799603, partial [Roridomyces roridus]